MTLRDTSGAETLWVLDTDYTLTDADLGSGTVTATTAPATGETLVIDIDPPNTQDKSLPIGGSVPTPEIENGLDIAAQRDAKLEALLRRAMLVPTSDSQVGSLNIPIDSSRLNKLLAFDSNGAPITADFIDNVFVEQEATPATDGTVLLWLKESTGVFSYLESSSWVAISTPGNETITQAKLAASLEGDLIFRVATRAAMKAVDNAVINLVYLDEGSRSGVFKWNSTTPIADHQADTQEGIYVPPAAGSIGAWVRVDALQGDYNIVWFDDVEYGDDVHTAGAAAITMAEYANGSDSVAIQNTFGAPAVYFPSGDWVSSGLFSIAQGGINIRGAGKGATSIKFTTTSGGFRFRHADYMDGQNIDNNGIYDIQLIGTATSVTASDVGISATITKHFTAKNIRLSNFSNQMDLNAVEEPVHLSNIDFWQNNSNFTAGTAHSLRVLNALMNTSVGTDDPDTTNWYKYCSMIFMDGCEFRSAATANKSHVLVQGVDGFKATNCHILGGAWQLQFNPNVANIPISNFVWNNVMFDGGTDTVRNIYCVNKSFTTEMSAFYLEFDGCKINDSTTENILIDHVDIHQFKLNGGIVDKGAGPYLINVQAGNDRGYLDIQGVEFRLGNGGPDTGTILLDAKIATFFNVVRVKNCLFSHDTSATLLPARHIQVESDKTTYPNADPQIILSDNDYATSADLTAGFLDDNSSPALTVAPVNRDNVSFTF